MRRRRGWYLEGRGSRRGWRFPAWRGWSDEGRIDSFVASLYVARVGMRRLVVKRKAWNCEYAVVFCDVLDSYCLDAIVVFDLFCTGIYI